MNPDRERAERQQQDAITAVGSLFVPACPGAGKTHVVVSRHLATPVGGLRQGRALLSFTRAASAQMSGRCRSDQRPEMAAFPNFIGTLDSWIWEFLVHPYLSATKTWQLSDSWSSHRADVKLGRRSVPLDVFNFVYNPDTSVDSAPWETILKEFHHLFGEDHPWEDWEEAARELKRDLYRAGYLTCHESRICALTNLRARGDVVLPPITSRFSEVIVDEVQDCNTTDVAILEALHDAGIKLTLVGDTDQMIYGWRDANLQRLSELTAKLDSTIELTGNRRSTPTICQLTSTLRTGTRPPDQSVGDHREDHPVTIIPTRFEDGGKAFQATTGTDIIEIFNGLAETAEIPLEERLVTARHYKSLPIPRQRKGGNQVTRLAKARATIASGTDDGPLIERACRFTATLLLGYWYPGETGSVDALCKAHKLRVPDLMRQSYAFLAQLPPVEKGWTSAVNSSLKRWNHPEDAAPKNGKGLLRGTPESVAKSRCNAPPDLRMDNVYQVKGDEAEAVLVLLPEEGTAARWRDNDPATDEELRILYVAMTRARQLLCLAVRADETSELIQLLDQEGVRHRVL